jgi:hypothetical protein
VHYQALYFFAYANAVLARLRAGNIGADVNVGARDATRIVRESKRDDVRRTGMIQVTLVEKGHRPRCNKRDRQLGLLYLLSVQRELSQRFERSGRNR